MASGAAGTRSAGRELPQLLALGFGAVYVVVGLLGFLVTGFSGFAEPNTNQHLLGFELNPFHNVGHLLTGVTGLLLGRTLAGARAYGWVLVVSHIGLLAFGLLYANQDTALNFFSFNVPDNVLHVGVILVGLIIALLPAARGGLARR
ncbi:MAG: DUF4383 domain-containing protein [Actinomycetota bacterium]|nr:DUF4383 domain-containing protein [Actinomycetota bacterium]